MIWKRIRGRILELSSRTGAIGLFYLGMIATSETITTMVNPYLGVFFHSVVLVTLLIHGSLVHRGILRRFLILLTLAPLIRILSLSIPLAKLGLPFIYWYMAIGALLFIAAFAAGRVTELKGRRIGWSWKSWPLQLIMGLSGFGLGFIEYKILNPGPLAAYITWVDILVACLILLIFTGVLEEYIFRGLMQSAAMQLMGSIGLVYVAVVFSVLHLGYYSASDVLFVLCVGLFFGWWAWKTHSLIGPSLAHGIANISLYVIFPLLINSGFLPVATEAPASISSPTVSVAAGTVAATTGTDVAAAEVIVDDEDRGFVIAGETLWLDTTDGYRESFHWFYASRSVPEVVGTWIPVLPGCGVFRVDAFIPQGNGLTESARYVIHHRLGDSEVRVNQSSFRGGWASLGIYEFESAALASVQLSNWTGEDQKLLHWVVFDAVRWIFLSKCTAGSDG